MNLHHLPNQRPNEHVVLFLRRHWFSLLRIGCAFALLTILPISLLWYFWDSVSTWLQDPFLGPLLAMIGCMYFLSIWLFVFLEFTDYYLDTWIITNERVLNIEQEGLFKRTSSELDLASVQDATAETRGFFETMFSYGNLFVQTAGEKERFHFKSIGRPEHVKEILMKHVQDDKQRVVHTEKTK